MVDLVYGRLSDENFIPAIAKLPTVATPTAGGTSEAEERRLLGVEVLLEPADSVVVEEGGEKKIRRPTRPCGLTGPMRELG